MLRPYQKEAIDLLKQSLKNGNKKIILTLATGAGKSIIAKSIVEMASVKNNQVLYTAHRTILIEQMRETFKGLSNVACETLQTTKNREYDDIKIIIADECHYGVNSKMQDDVLAKYPDSIVIGLSATPVMHDGCRIDGWDDIIDVVQLCDLIALGYASPVKVMGVMSVDSSNFKTTGNDYNSKDVSDEVNKSEIVGNVVEQFQKHAHDLRTIFFCINIEHANNINDKLISLGYKSSTYHSKLKNKKEIFNKFKNNELQILVSVESLTTGVDVPDIYCLVLATPTKSVIKAVQSYGRATRLNHKDKDKVALILDCADVVSNTVHPLERLQFNIEKTKKEFLCGCGVAMKIVSKTFLDEGESEFMRTERTFYKCYSCNAEEFRDEDKVVTFNFCKECQESIEKGTYTSFTRFDENAISLIAVCPHCEHEEVVRKTPFIKAELVEIEYNQIDNWDDVLSKLKNAKNKDGKKYHHKWSKIATQNLENEGFSVKEVVDFIRFYEGKGWNLGGIVNAMIKRRDK